MNESLALARPRKAWLHLAAVGCALVFLALVVVALVLFAKPRFGWLVGTSFLGTVASMVMIGALLVAVATWNLPIRKSWRGIALFAWAAIALTSPFFGYLFLLPWGVLLLTMPFVVITLRALYRA